MPTRDEALDFVRDSRRARPVPSDAVRVENFRRKNLSLKLVSPDADLLAILEAVVLLDAELAARESP